MPLRDHGLHLAAAALAGVPAALALWALAGAAEAAGGPARADPPRPAGPAALAAWGAPAGGPAAAADDEVARRMDGVRAQQMLNDSALHHQFMRNLNDQSLWHNYYRSQQMIRAMRY